MSLAVPRSGERSPCPALAPAPRWNKCPAAPTKRKLPVKRSEWPRIRDISREGRKCRYVLDLRPHVYGKGSRLYFENLEAAKRRAKDLATEHRNKGVEAIDFPTELRVEAAACHALLRPLGVSLREAVDHYLAWFRNEKHRAARALAPCA